MHFSKDSWSESTQKNLRISERVRKIQDPTSPYLSVILYMKGSLSCLLRDSASNCWRYLSLPSVKRFMNFVLRSFHAIAAFRPPNQS